MCVLCKGLVFHSAKRWMIALCCLSMVLLILSLQQHWWSSYECVGVRVFWEGCVTHTQKWAKHILLSTFPSEIKMTLRLKMTVYQKTDYLLWRRWKKRAQILLSWQSSREGVVMRNSLGKKERKSDYPGGKEEAEIKRKWDRKGKAGLHHIVKQYLTSLPSSAQMFLLITLHACWASSHSGFLFYL